MSYPPNEEGVQLALSRLNEKANKPCECFVIIVAGDEKQDILNPEIIGPFSCYRAAYEWVARLPNAIIGSASSPWPGSIILEPSHGGYCGWAIADDETAQNPQQYLKAQMAVYWDEDA